MILKLNNPEVQDFIQQHINEHPSNIALKVHKYPNLPIKEIAAQIDSRQRIKSKLPDWFNNSVLILPHRENLEQASSQKTAEFKASTFKGQSMLDLTGGSGIDSYYLSKNFQQTVYVEPDPVLCELASYNFKVLGREIEIVNSTAQDFIKNTERTFDVVYIDPSRRNSNKERLFGLEEYSPNVVEMLDELQSIGKTLVIKTSPMIDIKAAIKQLNGCDVVTILAVNNEVKEVLFERTEKRSVTPDIEPVNLKEEGNNERFPFNFEQEKTSQATFSGIQKYIYDANAAIRKVGAFKLISKRLNVPKLDTNTHLYSSDELASNFPGRVFEVRQILKPNRKTIRRAFPDGKVNVIARNYPNTTNQIKSKFGLHDGGEEYLIFCTERNRGLVAVQCNLANKE